MPLIKSATPSAIGSNIREMQKAGHSHDQSVAAALHTADMAKHASGGIAGFANGGMAMSQEVPWFERKEENSHPGAGFLQSNVGGRTDRLPVAVAADSYVIPADVVSGLGQGNSLSGGKILSDALKTGPYGTALGGPHISHGDIPRPPSISSPKEMDSKGGAAHHMPIMVAGGEFIVPPEVVERIGGGDVKKGHKLLEAMIHRVRAHTLKTIKNLPSPKK